MDVEARAARGRSSGVILRRTIVWIQFIAFVQINSHPRDLAFKNVKKTGYRFGFLFIFALFVKPISLIFTVAWFSCHVWSDRRKSLCKIPRILGLKIQNQNLLSPLSRSTEKAEAVTVDAGYFVDE